MKILSRNITFLPLWAILLIVGSGVAVVAGFTATIFYVINKKQKIKAKIRQNQTNNKPEVAKTNNVKNQTLKPKQQANNNINKTTANHQLLSEQSKPATTNNNLSNNINKLSSNSIVNESSMQLDNENKQEVQIRPDLKNIVVLHARDEWPRCFEYAEKFYNIPTSDNIEYVNCPALALWLNVQNDNNKKMDMLAKICKCDKMEPDMFPKTTALVIHEYYKIIGEQSDNPYVRKYLEYFLVAPKAFNKSCITEDIRTEFEKVKQGILEYQNKKLAESVDDDDNTEQNIITDEDKAADVEDEKVIDTEQYYDTGELLYRGKGKIDSDTKQVIRHGKGITYHKNGKIMFDGICENNRLKDGTLYNENGEVFHIFKPAPKLTEFYKQQDGFKPVYTEKKISNQINTKFALNSPGNINIE